MLSSGSVLSYFNAEPCNKFAMAGLPKIPVFTISGITFFAAF